MKDVHCALLGRPSSGKSTFVNTICENKVSIVSSIPQSTLKAVSGCYIDTRGRIVFTDTPGVHIDERKFNMRLTKSAINAVRNSDCVLYILDAGDEIGAEEEKTAFYALTSTKPVIALINKTDISDKSSILKKQQFLKNKIPGAQIFTGSALKDIGLDEVLIEIFKYGVEVSDSESEIFENSHWTDSTLEFRVAEEIRESIFEKTKAEIPHSVYVEVEDIQKNESDKVLINAVIYTEHNSQKGILIGKGGVMIKSIRTLAQKKLKKIFYQNKVDLFLNIKVSHNWKSDKNILDKLNL